MRPGSDVRQTRHKQNTSLKRSIGGAGLRCSNDSYLHDQPSSSSLTVKCNRAQRLQRSRPEVTRASPITAVTAAAYTWQRCKSRCKPCKLRETLTSCRHQYSTARRIAIAGRDGKNAAVMAPPSFSPLSIGNHLDGPSGRELSVWQPALHCVSHMYQLPTNPIASGSDVRCFWSADLLVPAAAGVLKAPAGTNAGTCVPALLRVL
jgi:hypothetical protein